jgi:hypothetical protein
MTGGFAKALLTSGVTVLSLLLWADCASADRRAAPASTARANLPVPIRAAESGSSRAGGAAAAIETKPDAAAAPGPSCEDQQSQLQAILAKGPEGSARDELRNFSKTVTCDRLGPLVVAAIDRFNADSAGTVGPAVNSLELVRATQVELARLGCFDGKISGSLTTTRDALARYMAGVGQTVTNLDITEALVADLARHEQRACPMSCGSGQTLHGGACIIDASRTDPAATIPPEPGQKHTPEGHAGPAETPREPPARPKAAAVPPHSQPAGHAGSPRPGSISGLGF